MFLSKITCFRGYPLFWFYFTLRTSFSKKVNSKRILFLYFYVIYIPPPSVYLQTPIVIFFHRKVSIGGWMSELSFVKSQLSRQQDWMSQQLQVDGTLHLVHLRRGEEALPDAFWMSSLGKRKLQVMLQRTCNMLIKNIFTKFNLK